MKIVTVISNSYRLGLYMLKLSCAIRNLSLDVLLCNPGFFTSNRVKDRVLLNYLDDLSDDEIILFTDGYDTLFMTGEEEILEKFSTFKKALIFSTETQCWPDPELANLYPGDEQGPYKYLNSGGFIGKAGLIKEVLSNESFYKNEKFDYSNQYLWTQQYFKDSARIGLDTNCEIFNTFSPEIGKEYYAEGDEYKHDSMYSTLKNEWFKTNFSINDGRIINKLTGTTPCQAHFNGASKCLLSTQAIFDMLFFSIPGIENVKLHYINP